MNLKRNRLFTLFLAALMLLTTLAGGLAALAEGSVELTVVTSYGGDDGNRKNYEAAVAAYEEATGNTVLDASSTSNEEWKARVLTDFETGTEPDVLFFFTNADAEPFINAGKVVDIETIRASYPEYGTNMKDSMFAVASDGKSYALPSSGFWENMFVNVRVLEACGIAPLAVHHFSYQFRRWYGMTPSEFARSIAPSDIVRAHHGRQNAKEQE